MYITQIYAIKEENLHTTFVYIVLSKSIKNLKVLVIKVLRVLQVQRFWEGCFTSLQWCQLECTLAHSSFVLTGDEVSVNLMDLQGTMDFGSKYKKIFASARDKKYSHSPVHVYNLTF